MSEIRHILNKKFPEELANDWDNVGLQIGTFDKEITTILLSLDLTPDVIKEAKDNNAELIITHHPLLFTPIKQIDYNTPTGKMIHELIQANITLYVMHTNFDIARGGLNHTLSNLLGLNNLKILEYETETDGIGLIGEIEEQPLNDFIKVVKNAFNLEHLKLITNNEQQSITTVALCGGSGHSLIEAAYNKQVDVYITGDIRHHDALLANSLDLTVIDVGHHVETLGLPTIKKTLQEAGLKQTILISTFNTNPFELK
ncbi:MAG: Nif3-like dinuclear metal center hexameric protein [Candidatus Izimaplasma sp.]|nr:Nif3-like dinuclear metal center hexameric protein [Candidatus Izimaplasma bacterium]